jgi:signal transduction histidine kinase
MRIFFITICFGFAYAIKFRSVPASNIYILAMFLSSFITINLLNYFNAELERHSLKNTAYQLTRTDVNLMDYLMTETLTKISEDHQLKNKFDDDIINYNAESYKIWSRSRLEREMISSSISIIDTGFNLLGSFSFNLFEEYDWKWGEEEKYDEGLVIKQEKLEEYGSDKLMGIVPIKEKGRVLGYVELNILIDIHRLGFENTPKFISTSNAFSNSPVNIENLKIFDYHNNELINYYTDLILSQEDTDRILNADFNEFNEAWLSGELNEVNHIIYVRKRAYDNFTRILAIALEEKDTSWNLFDFFKLFFTHSVFILIFLAFLYVFHFRNIIEVKYSFRTQLLFAFLLISIIPLIFLAGYFKTLTEEKNTSAVYYKLGKRADRVESYVNDYLQETDMRLIDIYNRANRDLGIEFSIYDDYNLEYSTSGVYYNIGLLPGILNSIVYEQILLSGLQEYVVEEKLDKFEFHSFYHRAEIVGQEYLIKVSDLFNKIRLPMTGTEVDIFLIGTYSIAVLLVILISTILANQISRPIRNLTDATRLVADGDLNTSVEEKNRGEIQELIDGFNSMVQELRIKQIELAEMERETAWKDMAKQVAHEIKNPLTPMKLSVQQLVAAHNDGSSKFDSIFNKVTNTIIHQIDTLKNIASEFSAFARMPKLKLEDVDIIKILFDTKILFTNEEVDIQIESEYREYIACNDFDQLLRTMINLVRNSIQAKATKVEMKLAENNEHYEITIRDNGIGIDEKYLHKIFDLNFTTKIEGMGIGLDVAKRFIESVGGKIEVLSSSSTGTTIVISLPKKINEQSNSLSKRSS